MKLKDAFPSRYISKEDVTPPLRYTIESIGVETISGDNGKDESKPLVYFHEPDSKPLILNQTNWNILAEAYGEDSDEWIDKPVEMFLDPNVMFGKKRVGGVRVRIPKRTARPQTVDTPEAAEPAEWSPEDEREEAVY